MKILAVCLLIAFASSQASPTSQVKGSQTKETAKTGSSSQEKVVFPSPLKASVKLVGSNPAVSGSLFLTQDVPESGPVRITGTVSGISEGSHGFHVHQLGDIVTNGCLSTGGHFNPLGHQHGAPEDTVRHAGDLGNIVADASGVAVIDVLDNQISLSGVNSIVGRAFVVHEKVDDLGRGGDSGSLATGNAGSRVACGVVGLM